MRSRPRNQRGRRPDLGPTACGRWTAQRVARVSSRPAQRGSGPAARAAIGARAAFQPGGPANGRPAQRRRWPNRGRAAQARQWWSFCSDTPILSSNYFPRQKHYSPVTRICVKNPIQNVFLDLYPCSPCFIFFRSGALGAGELRSSGRQWSCCGRNGRRGRLHGKTRARGGSGARK